MLQNLTIRLSIAAALALTASAATAANDYIDINNASNGLTDIYSATFDGALVPCGGGSSTYCTFFGGDPGATRAITIDPNPTTVIDHVPGGIGPGGTPVGPNPATGTFLDLTLSAGNTVLTLGDQTAATGDSAITFGPADICLGGSPACPGLDIQATYAGMVFNPTGPVNGGALTPAGGGSTGDSVPVNGSGQAVFQIQNAGGIVVDFSRFSQVVTSCTGTFCALVTGDTLNLDIVRYVLEIDYNPAFTSFTGNFIGETSNNSIIRVTLNSASLDEDADGDPDSADNCPYTINADQADGDSDGRGNMCDNCRTLANNTGGPAQCDSDGILGAGDGFGNRCDGDFISPAPGNGATNAQDYGFFRTHLSGPSPLPIYDVADINCNGAVNAQDYGIFRTLLGAPPGPGAGP